MDKLHLMTVFVAVAEEESFAGGSRRLAMSPPAVTRCIASLVKLASRDKAPLHTEFSLRTPLLSENSSHTQGPTVPVT